MVNFKPLLTSIRPSNFKLKIKLGVLLLCLSLLSNYQPTLNFPPVKKNIVYAEVTQQPSVSGENLGISFQLPHPGYITTHFSNYHPGIDLCSGLGMPIKTIAKGRVVEAGYNFFGLGLVVEVEHDGGYRSLYAHMGKIFVNKGQEVDVNDYLGEIGMTGHTSGPHTHLEISKDGKKIDPLLILPEIRKYPTEQDFVTQTSATPSAVIVPAATPAPQSTASASLNINPASNLIQTPEVEKEATKKIEIDKENLNTILNPIVASPKPSSSPMPQGGKITLRNFNIFKLK